ncbi:hypothetical protein BC828DRAFT_394220 [Blastocladiella britannica]|nr:hypothetical protein BC828DRAFT_394220 [Blastocladiella britannica]
MSSAYGSIARPATGKVDDAGMAALVSTLRFPISDTQVLAIVQITADTKMDVTSPLFKHLQELLNAEVRVGNTYPQEHELDAAAFEQYFLSADAFVCVVADQPGIPSWSAMTQWSAAECTDRAAGAFYVKPNYPGRCSHVCNGGFLVHANGHRGRGVGTAMALAFLRVAPALGYKASVFNLVFESNVPSVKLWRRTGFREIGRVPKAGRLRTDGSQEERFVDAIMFYHDFESVLPLSVFAAQYPTTRLRTEQSSGVGNQ